jgi:hypothetical protein
MVLDEAVVEELALEFVMMNEDAESGSKRVVV